MRGTFSISRLRLVLFGLIAVLAITACGRKEEPKGLSQVGLIPFKETSVDPEDVPTVDTYKHLRVGLEQVPTELVLQETAHYVAVLTNTSASAVVLRPCPAYSASYGEESVVIKQSSYLNCASAPEAIASGSSVRFEMRFKVEGRGIVPGFSGSLGWRLLSAPAEPDSVRFTPPISVRARATSQPSPSTTMELPVSDPFATDGRAVGVGRFNFGSQSGRWGIFLEGPPRAPTFRYLAVLDSGERVCGLSGSADGFDASWMHFTSCGAGGTYGLTVGFVPSNVTRAEVTLERRGTGRRTAEAEIGVPAGEARARPIVLVHAAEEQAVAVRGFGPDGTVVERTA